MMHLNQWKQKYMVWQTIDDLQTALWLSPDIQAATHQHLKDCFHILALIIDNALQNVKLIENNNNNNNNNNSNKNQNQNKNENNDCNVMNVIPKDVSLVIAYYLVGFYYELPQRTQRNDIYWVDFVKFNFNQIN